MIRFADIHDKEAVNALRKQVNDLHVAGRPDIFKPGFGPGLREHADPYLNREIGYAAVDETGGGIAGMVMVDYVEKPETPYGPARRFVHIAEICVDAAYRRQGVGKRLMDFVKADAQAKGYSRIELDVWAFNDVLPFYESLGFTVFRRFLECSVDQGSN